MHISVVYRPGPLSDLRRPSRCPHSLVSLSSSVLAVFPLPLTLLCPLAASHAVISSFSNGFPHLKRRESESIYNLCHTLILIST